MTFRITGIVPMDEDRDRFSPDAVAGWVGQTVPLLTADLNQADVLGRATIEGASIEAGTGDVRITLTYDDKADKTLRERGYSRKSLKVLAIGGIVDARTEPDVHGDSTITAFRLREVGPRINAYPTKSVAPR